MEYVYSAMLLHSAGKSVNEENLKKVLSAAGVQVDEARLKALTAALAGVNIDLAIASAVAMPAAGTAPTAPSAGPEQPKKKEEKKEEEEKVSEEEAAAGLGALFG